MRSWIGPLWSTLKRRGADATGIFLNRCEPDEVPEKMDSFINVNLFLKYCIKTLHFLLIFSSWSLSTEEGTQIPKHRVWTTGNKQFEIKLKGLKHYIFIIYIPRHVFPTPGAPATSKLKVGSIFWKKKEVSRIYSYSQLFCTIKQLALF